MANVAVVIVGINGWHEWTQPAIQSIQAFDPGIDLVVIDNASDTPYPDAIQLPARVCYAAAINIGIAAAGDPDWIVVLNNDIVATGSIQEALAWMTHDALWGNQLITFGDLRWLGLWLFVIPRSIRRAVGPFDEAFEVCGFDDTDYCLRAQQAGFRIEKSNLPVLHYGGKTRWAVPRYSEIRLKNKLYLETKHKIQIGDEKDWRVFN